MLYGTSMEINNIFLPCYCLALIVFSGEKMLNIFRPYLEIRVKELPNVTNEEEIASYKYPLLCTNNGGKYHCRYKILTILRGHTNDRALKVLLFGGVKVPISTFPNIPSGLLKPDKDGTVSMASAVWCDCADKMKEDQDDHIYYVYPGVPLNEWRLTVLSNYLGRRITVEDVMLLVYDIAKMVELFNNVQFVR